MFGLIIQNLPVSYDKIKQLSDGDTTKFICIFESPLKPFTPFCIFLTQPFSSNNFKGTIFGFTVSGTWEFLGILSNKFSNFFGYEITYEIFQIGICIEICNDLEMDIPTRLPSTKFMSEKLVLILENFYNYSISFEKTGLEYANTHTIPLKCFQDWYELAKKRLITDPSWPKK